MKVLGVSEEKIIFGPFVTRVFPDFRQDILEYFLKLRADFKPDLLHPFQTGRSPGPQHDDALVRDPAFLRGIT